MKSNADNHAQPALWEPQDGARARPAPAPESAPGADKRAVRSGAAVEISDPWTIEGRRLPRRS